jgi:hypothetical protein
VPLSGSPSAVGRVRARRVRPPAEEATVPVRITARTLL